MFYGGFKDKEDVITNFSIDDYSRADIVSSLEGAEILFASYGGRAYEGAAIVLYTKNGLLYEVHGSHCSCRGLEHQWSPEETTFDALIYRYGTEESLSALKEEHSDEAVAFLLRMLLSHEANKILLEDAI